MQHSRTRGRAVLILAAALALQGCAGWPRDRAAMVRETRCADFSFQVYFDEESARLTRAARSLTAEAANQLRGCPPATVEVVGLADYRGPPEPNLTLSRQRAEATAGALTASGFAAPTFRLTAAGQAGAVTSQGDVEPLRRRAEVFVRFTPAR